MSLPHHFSPQDLKDLPVVNSSHMFQEEDEDMSHHSDASQEHDSANELSHDSSHNLNMTSSSDEPVLKTMIRQKNPIDGSTKLRKVTTFKSLSDSEE